MIEDVSSGVAAQMHGLPAWARLHDRQLSVPVVVGCNVQGLGRLARTICDPPQTGRSATITAILLSRLGLGCTNVHMKRYTASELRARLSEALDEVARGGEVTVDRGKQTFRIVATPTGATTKARRVKLDFDLTDERILEGWTWEPQAPGRPVKLRVRGGTHRRRTRP